MKLRIRGNAIRLRLTRIEVEQLSESSIVEESVLFGPGGSERLVYAVRTIEDERDVAATFSNNRIEVTVDRSSVNEWLTSDMVGIKAEQQVNGTATLMILIEKDFACLKSRDTEDDKDAFPNPNESISC